MPNKCVVPGCKTGYASCKSKFPTFAAPRNDTLREEWQRSLQLTKPLLAKHFVCAKHFHSNCIIRSYKLEDESGNVLAEVPLKHVRLETNAIPTISPLQKSTQQQYVSGDEENLQRNKDVTDNELDTARILHASTEMSDVNQSQRNETCISPILVQSIEMPAVINDFENDWCIDIENATFIIQEAPNLLGHDLFTEVLQNPTMIEKPANWYLATPSSKKYIVLYELPLNDTEPIFPNTRRSLIIGNDMKINFSANGIRVNPLMFSFPDKFDNLEIINKTLDRFTSLNICCGISSSGNENLVKRKIAYTDNSNQLRHKLCPIITVERQCEACNTANKSMSRKKLRIRKRGQTGNRKTILQQQTLSAGVWKKKLHRQQCVLRRAKNRIAILKSVMLSQQAKMTELKEENVLRKCEELGIPDGQTMCAKENVGAAEKKYSK